MSLRDLVLLYLLAGLASAVAIYRTTPGNRAQALGAAALALPLWPLWAPIALTGGRGANKGPVAYRAEAAAPFEPKDARRAARSTPGARAGRSPIAEAASRIEGALREGVDACAGSSLESLLPRDAADRISAEVGRAAARFEELDALLGREGFDLREAERKVEELSRSNASPRALSTARLHLENVRRLVALRDHDARALGELADLVQALRTQLVLARFAGSSIEGAGGIVSEVWARVEGLGAALDAEDHPSVLEQTA
ncbi:MAG: hypothetical protein U0359_08555 [Byssovorax sp.]